MGILGSSTALKTSQDTLQAALLRFVQDLHQYLGSNPGGMREPPMRSLLNV